MENYLLRNLITKKGKDVNGVRFLLVEFQTLRYAAVHSEAEPILPVKGDVKFTYTLDKSNTHAYPVQNKFAYSESIKWDQFNLQTTTVVVVDEDENYAEGDAITLTGEDEDIVNISQHTIPEDE